jgi:hypothetical protein
VAGIQSSPWVRWQFDEAVTTWGRYVDAEVAKKKKPAQKKQVMKRLLTKRPSGPVKAADILAMYPGMVKRD